MKRLICLGTMLLPPGSGSSVPSNYIINLYTEIRNFASKDVVSGTLAIAEKTFVLLLEGDNKHIASLLRHLNLDTRVIDVSVVANYQIEEQALTDWKIRVVKPETADRNRLLEGLRNKLQGHVEIHKPVDQHRLKQFFQAAGYTAPSATGLKKLPQV